ncbi:carbohydrate ABC transporter permease [Phytohabitans kaempferiae]|uniref:Carbohydrate ABC transporter permease n=1 Tax=Phytohabitans kaempferiae TaxID=1620943 RepID=A0ABV6M3T0_9ACTN
MRTRTLEVARVGFLSIFTLVVVVAPFWLLLVNSAKPLGEANELGFGLPRRWNLVENYRAVFEQGHIVAATVNTLLIVVPSIVLICLLASAAAWVFGRRTSRVVNALYLFSISSVLLPPIIITTIYVLQRIGLYGGYAGAILFYVGAFSGLAIFLITGFVRTVPSELEEAARIDGAGPFRTYWSVVLPLLRPVIFTCSVFLFLVIWNDMLYQFFLLGGRGRDTLSLGLYNFAQVRQYQMAWNLVFADVLLVSLPPLILFFLAQRRILSGLTSGAINR